MSMKARQKRSRLGQQTHGSYCSARRTAGRLLSLETNSWLIHLVYSACPRSAKHQPSLSAMIAQYFIFLFFNTGPSNTALANVTPRTVRASAFGLNILIIHLFGYATSPSLIGMVRESLEHECGAVGCCGFNGRSGCALVLGCKILADGYQCESKRLVVAVRLRTFLIPNRNPIPVRCCFRYEKDKIRIGLGENRRWKTKSSLRAQRKPRELSTSSRLSRFG